jgi:hypothetical protein
VIYQQCVENAVEMPFLASGLLKTRLKVLKTRLKQRFFNTWDFNKVRKKELSGKNIGSERQCQAL